MSTSSAERFRSKPDAEETKSFESRESIQVTAVQGLKNNWLYSY